MPVVTVNLVATGEMTQRPIVWRLGRLFHVVTNIRKARVSPEAACISLDIEGSKPEVDQTLAYLHSLGLLPNAAAENLPALSPPAPPETTVSQSVTIRVRIVPVAAEQKRLPILYRVGKDFDVVVNIVQAAIDDEEGGYLEVELSGPLSEVQRAIAYLHTTGLEVYPYQRSVTDYSNL